MATEECNQKMRAIDFFCGVGGITYGFTKSNKIRVIAGIDIDRNCISTYVRNNPSSNYIQIDIHDLTIQDLINRTGIRQNDDSLIFIACSPCQFWSKVPTDKTKSKATKDLLREFERFVSYFKPGYLLIENVPGFFKNPDNKVLNEFIGYLKNEGYVCDHRILNANHYGVPQNRERFLLLATRLCGAINIPDAEFDTTQTVRTAIGDLSQFPVIKAGQKDPITLHSSASLVDANKKRISITPHDGGTRSCWKDDPELQIDAYRGKDNIFKDVYGRMFWDKPAPTITTRFNSISNGRFGHPEQDRAISLREGATLQTFPMDYYFIGSNEASIARQIGNAVPPELARRMGIAIIKNYESIKSIGIE